MVTSVSLPWLAATKNQTSVSRQSENISCHYISVEGIIVQQK